MSDLEHIVGADKVFHTVGEYRVGVTATVIAPCVVGAIAGICERFALASPESLESLCYGALAGAAGVMGYFFARRGTALAREREIGPFLSSIATVGIGAAAGVAYGAFAWVANQVGYWDVRIFTANF